MATNPLLLRPDGPLAPFVKWPGGKRQERPELLTSWPATAARYLEPFVGGGAMWLATDPTVPAAVNDASTDLVAVYRAVQDQDAATFAALDDVARSWSSVVELADLVDRLATCHPAADAALAMATEVVRDAAPRLMHLAPAGLGDVLVEEALVGIPRKLRRMAKVERDRDLRLPEDDIRANVEGAIRAAIYTTVRADYNRRRRVGNQGPERTAEFLVLRELAYASMFRFNASGDFNVPYGGLTYNGKDLAARAADLRATDLRARIETTSVHALDFADFFDEVAPGPDDFVFLDPPYLSDFRDYDGNGFGPADHVRLAACLRDLPGRFQLVVKATPETRDWYAADDWTVREADKTYAWTIKSRNDRRVTHLVIENA